MTYTEIVTAIMNGDLDEDLKNISTVIREREKIVKTKDAAIFKATVPVGSKVRLQDIRPKYLVGQMATVTSVDVGGNRVEVELDMKIGKWGNGPVKCPASCLEVVEAS